MKKPSNLFVFLCIFPISAVLVNILWFSSAHEGDSARVSESKKIESSPIQLSLSNNDSYELKIKHEKKILEKETIKQRFLTEQGLYQKLVEKGIDIDEDLANRMKSGAMTDKDYEWLQVVIAQNMSDEENFKVEVSALMDYSEIKAAYKKRTEQTGLFYGNEILNNPNTYKTAKANDIIALINEGSTLPKDALLNMIAAGNLGLAKELKTAGYLIDAAYVDESTTMGALEAQVEIYTWFPSKLSIEKQYETFESLAELGAPLNKNDGTRDALDRVLGAAYATNDSNDAERLMLLAVKLNQMGIALSSSHFNLIDKVKVKYPDVYQQHSTELN